MLPDGECQHTWMGVNPGGGIGSTGMLARPGERLSRWYGEQFGYSSLESFTVDRDGIFLRSSPLTIVTYPLLICNFILTFIGKF